MSGSVCPKCSKDVGFWPLILTFSNSYIKCPHCKTILKYENVPVLLVTAIFLVFIIVILGLSIWLANTLIITKSQAGVFVGAILLPVCVCITLVITKKKAKLVLSENPRAAALKSFFIIMFFLGMVVFYLFARPYIKTYVLYQGCLSFAEHTFSDTDKLKSYCSCSAESIEKSGLNAHDFKSIGGREKFFKLTKHCMN